MVSHQMTENLAYHATRLLLLISLCGKPRSHSAKSEKLPGIEGRTLLAKLDFFVRYPVYLYKAAIILNTNLSDRDLGIASEKSMYTVESRMVRYLYGPWDDIYYAALGYLVGKELIEIEKNDRNGTEIFRLTLKGRDVADNISNNPTYADLAARANAVYHLFNKYTGNSLKEFIYNNFPEVVGRKIGTLI